MAAIKGGYWGKILWIDLTNGKTSVETFDDAYARKYLGGVGLAAKIISGKVTKHTNPLGAGNVLVFATGPYQATDIAGLPFFIVMALASFISLLVRHFTQYACIGTTSFLYGG